jgi:hypothetical protein
VTFRWKDYQRGNRQRTMTLEAVEFLGYPLKAGHLYTATVSCL